VNQNKVEAAGICGKFGAFSVRIGKTTWALGLDPDKVDITS
jgi:hypothetical protein